MSNQAFSAADLLLPKAEFIENWAAVACDQFTSEPEYWEKAYAIAGDKPSTLGMILPEVYLEQADVAKRIEAAQANMEKYLTNGVFAEYPDAMIYIERVQSDGAVRAGLVGKVDLGEYDYRKGSKSLIRATEQTVVERIPPRLKVREGAPVELPHIMILIDDAQKRVIEPLATQKNRFVKLYDTPLMLGGGRLTGYLLDDAAKAEITAALAELADLNAFNARYDLTENNPMVYAMGDGNHSLATAKEFYENLKKNNPSRNFTLHPARYALAELVNLHSPALAFEAIHRIVTEVDANALFTALCGDLGATETPADGAQEIAAVLNCKVKKLYITKPTSKLAVGSLQGFLDDFIRKNGGKIDYIHGEQVVLKLSAAPDSIGFLLPCMGKDELFPTVIADGALPRKTFSMGHAEDKRYYMEARKITL
ncbi:MAG: DUF1015 domain-containing protein [Oscillospiraceae bacterium]